MPVTPTHRQNHADGSASLRPCLDYKMAASGLLGPVHFLLPNQNLLARKSAVTDPPLPPKHLKMSQMPPYVHVDDQHVSTEPTHPPRPEPPALKYSANFFLVGPRTEESDGEEYNVQEVSTCLFEQPLSVNSSIYNGDDTEITWVHADLAKRIMRGVRRSEAGHGFWRVDENLVADGAGYVRICEFGDLSFDIHVPAHLQGRCFDIGTKDVAFVLTSIWEEMRDYYREPQPEGNYSILQPPFWGSLVCKGRFDQGGEADAYQQAPAPAQGESFSLFWRVQELKEASHQRHRADLELQDKYEGAAGNDGLGGQYEEATGSGSAGGAFSVGQGQSLGVSGWPSGLDAGHDHISSSRSRHPGA